jgi:phage repressor protein C with HTH and peptisase S24 domain
MLNERISYVIDIARVTQGEFGVATGIPLERVRNMVGGRIQKLKQSEAQIIRHLYGINEDWLLTGKGKPELPKGQLPLKQALAAVASTTAVVSAMARPANQAQALEQIYFAAKSDNKALFESSINELLGATEMVYVPRYDIKASAGGGAFVHDESIVDHLAFKRDWLINTLECKPDAVCVIQVRGDSMTPTFNDSDLLLLDIRTIDFFSEGVYVIQLKGALLVKRLRFKISGVVDVISDNIKYGVESLSPDELDRLTIIGRVVWHGSKF